MSISLKKQIKRALPIVTALSLSVFALPAHANGMCGIGKLVEVREGGWNLNDLLIKLEYTQDADTALIGTNYRQVWIRYQEASLSPERLRSIRALAYMALVSGKSVYTWSHNVDGCTDSTELSVFNDGVDPSPR